MKIGIADTTFARINMAKYAIDQVRKDAPQAKIERYTVPGFKDLPVACKKLIEEYQCDIVIALSMAGSAKIDEQCAFEASLGLTIAQLLTNKHIINVMVYTNEAKNEKELLALTKDRVQKHALNALALLAGKTTLTPFAGKGMRQGRHDAGELKHE
ncbi:riboflavin synthase [Candidatus Woesearchaeota archaeon]|nr:riboflavin synthase [Candidatus Woesearchaeota archaeon]